MAKRQRSGGVKLRRSCGAMAAHMALLEKYPSFRLAQMRLEGAVDKRRKAGVDLQKLKLVTIKTVVNVVYRTDEENISDGQIASQIKAMNKDFRATNSDKSQTPAAWKGLVTDSRIQFKLVDVTRTKTSKAGFTHDDAVKKASGGGVAPFDPKAPLELLGVCADRRTAGLRAVPGGPGRHRRRGRQLPGVRHEWNRDGTIQQRANRDA